MSDAVLTEQHGPVLLITLHRPDSMNAVDGDVARGLVQAVEQLDGDPALTVGVLTGSGGAFCAGMDLKAFRREGMPEGFGKFLVNGSTKPLLAAIEGMALAGGLEVALTCDLLVAARGSRLGIPEVAVGFFAAGGALARLPRMVPFGVAAEMAMTGEPISAEQAHAYGLVSRLAEPGEAVAVASELARRIAENAPLALSVTKRLLREQHGLTEPEFWRLQAPLVKQVFGSDDAKEGARAFAEKRRPRWTGR